MSEREGPGARQEWKYQRLDARQGKGCEGGGWGRVVREEGCQGARVPNTGKDEIRRVGTTVMAPGKEVNGCQGGGGGGGARQGIEGVPRW